MCESEGSSFRFALALALALAFAFAFALITVGAFCFGAVGVDAIRAAAAAVGFARFDLANSRGLGGSECVAM